MKKRDWEEFHNAVYELYPSLGEKMVEHLGTRISDQQILLCHLIRIGLTNPEIQRLTNIPKVTVWRWARKLEWVLED